MAYLEFEMPDRDLELSVPIRGARIQINLQGEPRPGADEHREIEKMVILEREEPTSSIHGNMMRRMISGIGSMTGRSVESIVWPMYGAFGAFNAVETDGTMHSRR